MLKITYAGKIYQGLNVINIVACVPDIYILAGWVRHETTSLDYCAIPKITACCHSAKPPKHPIL